MNLEKFTESSAQLIQAAATIATENQSPTILPLHLLAASIKNEFCMSFYKRLHISVEILNQLISQEFERLPKVSGGQLNLDNKTEILLQACQKSALDMGDQFISLEHFLLEFAATKNILPEPIVQFLHQHQFTKQTIINLMSTLRKGKKVTDKNAEKQYCAYW